MNEILLYRLQTSNMELGNKNKTLSSYYLNQ